MLSFFVIGLFAVLLNFISGYGSDHFCCPHSSEHLVCDSYLEECLNDCTIWTCICCCLYYPLCYKPKPAPAAGPRPRTQPPPQYRPGQLQQYRQQQQQYRAVSVQCVRVHSASALPCFIEAVAHCMLACPSFPRFLRPRSK